MVVQPVGWTDAHRGQMLGCLALGGWSAGRPTSQPAPVAVICTAAPGGLHVHEGGQKPVEVLKIEKRFYHILFGTFYVLVEIKYKPKQVIIPL